MYHKKKDTEKTNKAKEIRSKNNSNLDKIKEKTKGQV